MIVLTCPRYCVNVFQQVIQVFEGELRQHLYYDVRYELTENLSFLNGQNVTLMIIFGSQHIPNLKDLTTKASYTIIYNLEQLHFQKWKSLMDRWKNEDGVDEIWDYSNCNIAEMTSYDASLGMKCRKMKLGYSPFFSNESMKSLGLDKRLAFIGNISDYRLKVMENISAPFKVYNQHYFNDYQQIVAQHNAFLNIHFQEPAILEVVRILPLVCSRKYIYSQSSCDSELDEIFSPLVHFSNNLSDVRQLGPEDLEEWRLTSEPKFQEFRMKHALKNILSDVFIQHPQWLLPKTLKFCIATLHCNNRQTIFKTIQTFLDNTKIHPVMELEWVILSQGCSDEHNEEIEECFKKSGWSIRLVIIPLLVNMGWSNGMNELYQYINEQQFTLVLHLEDDWICDSSTTGTTWLMDSLIFMTHHNSISTMFLRQYRSDAEKQHYGWTRSFRYNCFKQTGEPFNYQHKIKSTSKFHFRSLELREIPCFMYTANPTLFRLRHYFDAGVFPFPVYRDASNNQIHWSTTTAMDAPEWGQAEAISMEKLLPYRCMNVGKGIFYHHF